MTYENAPGKELSEEELTNLFAGFKQAFKNAGFTFEEKKELTEEDKKKIFEGLKEHLEKNGVVFGKSN